MGLPFFMHEANTIASAPRLNHHLGPGNGLFPGAAAARKKTDDLHWSGLCKGLRPFRGHLEIKRLPGHMSSVN